MSVKLRKVYDDAEKIKISETVIRKKVRWKMKMMCSSDLT